VKIESGLALTTNAEPQELEKKRIRRDLVALYEAKCKDLGIAVKDEQQARFLTAI